MMANQKKTTKKVSKKSPVRVSVNSAESQQGKRSGVRGWFRALSIRRKNFLKRRPHRSFRVTRRRDYVRSLKLPGYWSLTTQILTVLKQNKRLFLGLALLYALFMLFLVSMMSQDTYLQLREAVDQASSEGTLGGFASTIALFWGVLSSQVTSTSTGTDTSQQIIGAILGLFAWLSTVWLLRSILAGQKPRIRDGIYSSGGPVVALFVLVFVLLLQLIPAALALIAYGAADTSGLFDQTAVLMLFGGGSILLVALSVYWITSTLIAMVIVTLPGMYPMRALRLAGDIVVGRRIRILLRLVWAVVMLAIVWVVVLVPVILFDGALRQAIAGIDWLPLVPIVALLLAAFSIVFMASYIYLFYRKVVEDDSAPA